MSAEISDESWKAEHESRRMALMFEALRNSSHVPFTAWPMITVYESRVLDITWDEETVAILVIDIEVTGVWYQWKKEFTSTVRGPVFLHHCQSEFLVFTSCLLSGKT